MFYVNGCSAIVSLICVLAAGEMSYCLSFAAANGDFVGSVAILSLAAASSQYFIYSQVKEFGALAFAATMNVRQVVSILVSYKTYDHAITALQVVGLLVVFAALFAKSYSAVTAPKKEEKEPLLNKMPDEPKATA